MKANNPLKPSLKNKTILITGGTSQLGRAFVTQALEAGACVFLTYFQNQGEAQALEKQGAKIFPLDLLDMHAIEGLAKEVRSQTKSLDVLIHNAAVVRDHTVQNMSEAEWDEVMSANLKAPYYLTKKLLPLLFKSEQAKIFFLTSRVALQGGVGVSNYAAAKAGLIGLTKSLAQELGKKKILVNAINPGFMKSAMTQGLPEAVIQKNLEAGPLNDYSNPLEVAQFLTYLCSDVMTQVTGQILHFEGRKIS